MVFRSKFIMDFVRFVGIVKIYDLNYEIKLQKFFIQRICACMRPFITSNPQRYLV